jgi:hypothetical protein
VDEQFFRNREVKAVTHGMHGTEALRIAQGRQASALPTGKKHNKKNKKEKIRRVVNV